MLFDSRVLHRGHVYDVGERVDGLAWIAMCLVGTLNVERVERVVPRPGACLRSSSEGLVHVRSGNRLPSSEGLVHVWSGASRLSPEEGPVHVISFI